MKRQICMLKLCGSGGVVKSDYSVSSLSEKESRERESLTILPRSSSKMVPNISSEWEGGKIWFG